MKVLFIQVRQNLVSTFVFIKTHFLVCSHVTRRLSWPRVRGYSLNGLDGDRVWFLTSLPYTGCIILCELVLNRVNNFMRVCSNCQLE